MHNFPFVGLRRLWYTGSGLLVAASIVLFAIFGLRYGLDFTGGSLLEVGYASQRPTVEALTQLLKETGAADEKIQPSGSLDYIIRLPEISEDKHQDLLKKLSDQAAALAEGNTLSEKRFESFGPTLGSELKRNAVIAIILVLIAIIAYLAYAFRKVSRPVSSWKFGVVAVIALTHDIFIPVGLFTLLGLLYGTEVDSLFVTALLTLLGFSVHDTIVTLDRIRENLFKHQDLTFSEIVNVSINETFTRSINTSLSTLFALIAIYFFGGATIRNFVLVLIIGIIIGTYSSVFIAAPLLVTWHSFSSKRKI
ncbi:MAG: protein-export membrane protein SecF [Candidatus Komeilibacteria bacterium RIFCSPLOWO2_01_FULL_52_15]|uniref:Protein-export membrane protein SecF n=2 Tax=Candidatus Komeiliibacteriota TaxID=1817908 RepID=A0A1G2BTJ2_9BACT|nr:MAG: protein-export membrane protein SecF [Candidatus Komeilibacteria bacterium RIFCSPHIGHO2_01_FULL_52_14]OGY91557.1 MAG: protein-export membrane protein SecF [Candidatus Komeilibacteria bacterium RIFCSPLOWO2_01_FULL_52_15]